MKKLILILFLVLLLGGCSITKKIDPNIYTGSVEGTEIILKSELSGKIENINYSEGDRLNENDIIIEIDNSDLKINLEKNIILRDIAKITYNDLLNGINEFDLKSQENKINSIEKQINEAVNNKNYYEKIYNDNKKLYNLGSISKSKLDGIELNYTSTKNKLELLLQEKNVAVNQYNKLETSISDETILKAKKEIELRNLDIKNIENQIEKSNIKSPIKATIQNINFSEGEIINQNSNLCAIINQDKLYLNIYIPEKYLDKINLGKKVYFEDNLVNTDTYGEIFYISNKAEFTPKNVESKEEKQELVFKVKIRIINPNNIKPGMYMTINISGDKNE